MLTEVLAVTRRTFRSPLRDGTSRSTSTRLFHYRRAPWIPRRRHALPRPLRRLPWIDVLADVIGQRQAVVLVSGTHGSVFTVDDSFSNEPRLQARHARALVDAWSYGVLACANPSDPCRSEQRRRACHRPLPSSPMAPCAPTTPPLKHARAQATVPMRHTTWRTRGRRRLRADALGH